MKQMSTEQITHIKTSLAWQKFLTKLSNIILCMNNAYILASTKYTDIGNNHDSLIYYAIIKINAIMALLFTR